MPKTDQLIKIPNFGFNSKHADIKARRGEDFHYSWDLGGGRLLMVEYIPDNWPQLEVRVMTNTIQQMKALLNDCGFEVEE